MNDTARYKLLFGPYKAPKCRIGDKLYCEVRKRHFEVRAMSTAPVPWPQTQASEHGRLSIIVTANLVKALRVESTTALSHLLGVTYGTLARWRRILGIRRWNEGARQLFLDHAKGEFLPGRSPPWSPEEDALLRELPVAEVARRTGRSRHAVHDRRHKLKFTLLKP
jgi:hypothetical protein